MNGHDDAKKKVVHATVCAPAAETLRAFCVYHGTTITAFLDGLGHALAPLVDAPMDQLRAAAPALAEALATARQVDAVRRTRDPLVRPANSNGADSTAADHPG